MIRSTTMRLAMLGLAAGLIAVLPATAAGEQATSAAAKAKAKTKLVNVPFLLPTLASDQGDGVAVCPSKTTLLGGGALSNTPPPVGLALETELFRSGPLPPRTNAWFVLYDNDSTPGVPLQPSAQAICLKDKLKVTGVEGSPKAVTKVKQVSTPFTLPPDTPPTNGHAQFDVACPKGTTIAGGGASFNVDEVDIRLEESGPQGNGWHVRYDNDIGDAVTATASALCLKSKLKVEGENEKVSSEFEQVDQAVTVPPETTNDGRARFTVACPKGTTVAGGGGKLNPAAPLATTDIQLEESGAVGNAWQVTFDNETALATAASAHALCLKAKLKVK
jgi:hypothetical protein